MQTVRVSQLDGNRRVAGQAAICHFIHFPESDMAGLALVGQFCMRMDTAEGFPGLCVQRTGVEQHPALYQCDASDDQGCEDCGNDPASGQAAETVIHAGPTLTMLHNRGHRQCG